MIKEVTGDILLSKAGAIAHGIAPNDDFKQGLALALREQWPAMYKDFRHYCQTYNPKPGSRWSWKGPGAPGLVHLFSQEAPDFKKQKMYAT
jgi:O-acetyl-ADP-ribose deacetylase (regulator of RNase III)